ncbi:nucleotidyltransferase family protein [Candidatus Pacearchaeota archaeon]|nr:nucleotidyltransferase family protein [Candidatus Pacearchaeota archaeon]
MKVIILAGGLGERLRPLTDEVPKPLLPILGKPILEYCIENLKKHGLTDIILSVGYKSERIKEYFGDGSRFRVKILYNIESQPLGTGGAVKEIVNKLGIKDNFLLLWGDNIADYDISRMLTEHHKTNAEITMSLTPREDVENFGVIELEGNRIIKFVEKPKREEATSNLINAGAFIIAPKALDILPDGKSSIERQCFESVSLNKKRYYAFKHKGYWFPTDTLEKYKQAEEEIRRVKNENLH